MAGDEHAGPARRRRWPWAVAALSVVVLLVVAAIAAESITRSVVESTVRERVIETLELPADQQLDVDVPGLVLPQVIGGTLDTLHVSSDAVSYGSLTAAVDVTATAVDIRGGALDRAEARLVIDEAQLQAVLAEVPDVPDGRITLAAPSVVLETELRLFALSVPVGVSLQPSAEAGDLLLTPRTLTAAGAEIDAQALIARFGQSAAGLVDEWRVCVADRLPAGVALRGVAVRADGVVIDLDVDGAIATDPALQEPGTCG